MVMDMDITSLVFFFLFAFGFCCWRWLREIKTVDRGNITARKSQRINLSEREREKCQRSFAILGRITSMEQRYCHFIFNESVDFIFSFVYVKYEQTQQLAAWIRRLPGPGGVGPDLQQLDGTRLARKLLLS